MSSEAKLPEAKLPEAMTARRRVPPRTLSVALPLAVLVLVSLLVGFGGCGPGASDRPPVATGEEAGVDRLPPGATVGPARSFLLLTLDTTRPDHLSPYGAKEVETPHLQALATAGAVLEHAFATTPVTLPSHASIFTGLDPPGHGVRNNGTHVLPAELPTLATVLRDRGFATGAFVSAAVLEARYGLDRGFATYDDDLSGDKPREPRMIAERPAEVTVDAALTWLDGLAEARYFLWVHLFDPHAAYEPPSPWAERFSDRPYDGEIAYMDHHIGRLLAHPRVAAPTTLVMAVGDHGESLGEHGEASHAMLAYDATLRIPWIVRGPGVAPGGRISQPVSQIDLFPTVLGLLEPALEGIRLELPGRDLTARLLGASGSAPPRSLYAETFVPFYTYGWARLRTLRREGWKYIAAPTPELYDITRDPGELENLQDRRPRRAAELAARLDEIADADGGESRAVRSLDRETRERLRSLGYLSGSAGTTESLPDSERPDPKRMMDVHRAVERAEGHLHARDFETAVAELRRVLARDRANRAALVSLATALGESGRPEEAAEAAQRALALHPEDPELHLTLAGLEVARSRPEEALDALDAALALDPRSVDARVEKARVLLQRSDELGDGAGRAEAIALLEQVLEEDPDHGRARVAWAEEVEAERGDLEAAGARLREVTVQQPFLAEAWRALGRVLERQGRTGEAEAAYRGGLRHQPRDPRLQALLGLLLVQRGEAEEAEPLLEAAVASTVSPLPEVHDGLAAVAVERGDWPRAERQARHAVELAPELASAWNHLAVALEEQGRTEDALDAYGRAVGADGSYWQALFNRGLLLRKQDRVEGAMEMFRRVLELKPGHAASHYELGVLHGARGEDARARRHLEAALSADPEHPRAGQIRRLLAALAGRG